MPKTRATAAPAKAGDKRKDDDRREKSERRLTMVVWQDTERRPADDRRSWVGRRQAAEWRRSS